ncbi:Signal transduction histidine kinase [Pseudonocardia oroxyli]|uniref:histidine kinase n=2 Tax=Pseudonocardia oroxyli TaxID=366584 RepID=A0A1G7VBW3_PSEOR|nr:Signal transduction histidine kinase [Pseudonocardia oroxyli]
MTRLLEWLPRGNTLDDAAWHRRHRLLQVVLAIHIPVLLALGLFLGNPPGLLLGAGIAPVVAALLAGHFVTHKRTAASLITAGLVWCSITLVAITGGTIEAHFHFFIIIGFIALYQDWVPFLWNVLFTGVSHAVGTIFFPTLIFNHPAAQQNPVLWSCIHAFGVLLACVGLVIFWRITEDEQSEKQELGRELVRADAEIGRKQFTSDMLVNLARRNQSMLYRQLDIINQLEEKEQDPDQLAELFKLDHLATRVRRNAESLLVLSGEQPPRVWSAPVSMRDVVRAAIAETEDLDRVEFSVDDRVAVAGHSVADLTHLLAELTENAVRFSPPDTSVTIRSRPHRADVGGQVLTVEDWGVGMPADELAAANEMLLRPREVDLSVSQRLGFHVVARLAARHRIEVSLSTTPGSGLTAVVILPAELFVSDPQAGPHAGIGSGPEQTRRATAVHEMAPAEHGVVPGAATATAVVDRPSLPGIAAAPAWTPPPSPARPQGAPGGQGPAPRPAADFPSVPSLSAAPPVPSLPPLHSGPSGPLQQGGNWSGWWDPAPADRAGGNFGVWTGPGPDGAEQAKRASGSGPNGHGDNGANGANGHENGHADNGFGHRNGAGVNGAGVNGAGANGAGRTGANGLAPNGRTGAPQPGSRPGRNGHDGNGHVTPGRDPRADAPSSSRTEDRALDGAAEPATDQSAPTNGVAAEQHEARERLPIPSPRSSPAEPSTGASGLRRRVPQASLAPELKAAAASAPAPSPARSASPNAVAASALSRYQASRQAAQVVADQQDHHHTDERTHP